MEKLWYILLNKLVLLTIIKYAFPHLFLFLLQSNISTTKFNIMKIN